MKKLPLLSIIVVTYNSEGVISSCLNHIKKQNYNSYEAIVVDNASSDTTLRILSNYSWIKLIKNAKNLGFSKANNQGIQQASGDFILLLNPDAFATSSSLKTLIYYIQSDSSLGFVCPKLLKPGKKHIIDSTGIQATPERRFFDRGRLEIDKSQYDKQTNFFAYLEDVDLCWRMRLRGWKGAYCPKALVYHQRGHDLARHDTLPFFTFLRQRLFRLKKPSDSFIRRLSFSNSFWILLKNDSLCGISLDFFHISFYWCKRLIYILFIEPYVFLEFPVLIRRIPRMLKKRKLIIKSRLVQPLELRKFFKS